MTIKDLIFISNMDRFAIAYQLNIDYCYLSKIRNKKISSLTRDLRLKIELFLIRNDLKELLNKYIEALDKSYKEP